MPVTVLARFPLRESILAHYRPTLVVVPDVRVDVSFDDPAGQLATAFRADPLLQQRMVDRVQQLLKQDLAKLMAHAVAMTEVNITSAQKAGRADLVNTYGQQLGAKLAEVKTQILPKVEQAGMAVLAELAVKRKEYRQYKIKAGLNVTLGVVGVGAGIASIALSGGGSSLVSLIGIVRGVSEIVQQCKSLYDEAEAVSRKVHAGILASLKNRTENRDVNALLEVGRAVVKSLTTIDFVPTPAKCEELNGTFRIKLTGLDVGAHDAAKQLNKLLETNEGLEEFIKKANQPSLAAKLEAAEAKVHRLIERILTLGKRVEAGELEYKFYQLIIADLRKGVAAWGAPVATAAKLLINTGIGLGSGAAGGAIDGSAVGGLPFGSAAQSATEGAVGTGKIFSESLGTLTELIGDYQEIASLFGPETAEQVQKAYPDLKPITRVPPPVPPRPPHLTVKVPTTPPNKPLPPLPPRRPGA